MQQHYSWSGIQPAPIAPNGSEWIERLRQSELHLQRMTEQLTLMQKQIDEIKSKPPLHIEYHFDQLKVNRLEGTLNVGLSPQGIQDLESFEAPDPAKWEVKSDQPEGADLPLRNLQNEMAAYMNDNSTPILMGLERQYGVSLDEEHREKVAADVKKQLNDRVRYYVQTSPYPDKGTAEEQQKWNETIKEKTRRDIQGAFSAYLNKMAQQPEQRSSGSL